MDAVRQRVRELYLERLLPRERPAGGTPDGWCKILKTFQDSLESRLSGLHTVEELHAFALRCLKDSHLGRLV